MSILKSLALAGTVLSGLSGPALALAPGLPAVPPTLPIFGITPGATATSAVVNMAMPNGVRIPIGTLNPTAGTFAPYGLDGALVTAANNAAMVAYLGPFTTMRRLGHDAAGDTVPVDYTLMPGPCPIPGGDGGSQIPRALGGCWTLNPTMRTMLSTWAGKGSADDTPSWAAALAYLGSFGTPRMLVDDLPVSTLAGPMVTIPSKVSLSGDGLFEGADSVNLPNVRFANPAGGFYCPAGAALRALWLTAVAKVDHLVEIAGQCHGDTLRYEYNVNGIVMTRAIKPGVSSANLALNTTSGLVNGTYAGKSFTGGGGSGATVSVAVQNGAVVAVTPDGAGTGYAPWFDFGFAAGALYQGSPAIPAIGQMATANTGRSTWRDLIGISYGATKIGFELDAAYDFPRVEDAEMWSPGGITPPSVGFRFGHLDGGKIDNPMAFGMNTAMDWSDATTGAQSFASMSNPQFDGVGYGLTLSFPLAHLAVTGGYTRSIAKALTVNSPTVDLTWTGHVFFANADLSAYLEDFEQVTMTGNAFKSPQPNQNVPHIHVGLNVGAQQGEGNFYIGGNVTDGKRPFVVVDATAKGGLIGENRWPGRKYPATDGNGNATFGYAYAANGNTTSVEPIINRQVGTTADASGSSTVPWELGYASSALSAQFVGPCASAGYRIAITSIGTEGFTFTTLNSAGQPVPGAACALLFKA